MWHNFWLGRRCGNVVLMVLMLTLTCNIIFYSQKFLRKSTPYENTCDFKTYLKVSMKFIDSRGTKSFKEILQSHCPGVGENSQDVQQLIWALLDLVSFCKTQARTRQRPEAGKPILTLFTSWDSNETKHMVHNNTVTNWIMLKKYVNPIIFTNDTHYTKLCKDAGWDVFPISHYAAGSAPVLKTMFLQAMENYNTSFYAFANGDILFEDGLIDTLTLMLEEMPLENMTRPMLIIGRRTNVKYLSKNDASSYKNLRNAARSKGQLFLVNAEDYFITSRNFPWKDIPPLVIGRPAYDNWLVAYARRANFTVVDASETILAVHQTTSAGNWEGHKRKFSNYNDILLKRLKLPRRYRNGETWCAPLRTSYDLCSRTIISERKIFHPQCILNPG